MIDEPEELHSMTFKNLNKIMAGLLIITLSLLVYVGWQRFRPYKIATVETPIVVKNKNVTDKEPVTLLITTCSYNSQPVTLRVQLLTKEDVATPIYTLFDVRPSKGCTKLNPLAVPLDRAQLPLNTDANPSFSVEDDSFPIDAGEYRIRLVVTYELNLFRKKTVSYDSEQFNYTP